MNDVLNVLGDGNDVYLYADDIIILSKNINPERMILNLQNKMDKIYKLCMLNKLTINESKTKYMIVTPRNVNSNRGITIGKQSIGRVKQYEYLGMMNV